MKNLPRHYGILWKAQLPFNITISIQYCLQQKIHHGIPLWIIGKCQTLLVYFWRMTWTFQWQRVTLYSLTTTQWIYHATTLKCYESEVPVANPFSFILGQINGCSKTPATTRVEFFFLLKEFLPQNANSHMYINTGPCASMKKLIKNLTLGLSRMLILLILHLFTSFLVNIMHAVAAGMDNVFICHYVYKDENQME